MQTTGRLRPEVLVMRATLRQCTHDFAVALADIDAALKTTVRH